MVNGPMVNGDQHCNDDDGLGHVLGADESKTAMWTAADRPNQSADESKKVRGLRMSPDDHQRLSRLVRWKELTTPCGGPLRAYGFT